MSDLPLLIYCSLLRKAQYKQLRDLATLHHGAVDIVQVEKAIRAGVDKRLKLAQQFLQFADSLLPASGTDDMAARNAVSRAYYATHHALRALLLFEERGDIDGHREAIEAASDLIKRNSAVRAKLGERDDFRSQMQELLEQRHLADYYPYGASAPKEEPVDFASLATAAVQFARHIVEKTNEYISQKERSN